MGNNLACSNRRKKGRCLAPREGEAGNLESTHRRSDLEEEERVRGKKGSRDPGAEKKNYFWHYCGKTELRGKRRYQPDAQRHGTLEARRESAERGKKPELPPKG